MSDAAWEISSSATIKHPTLEKYESVSDISGMYNGTGVVFISRKLLDLPFSKNTPENPLNWDSFIQGMNRLSISNDALYNISYRLKSYSYINFSIYEYTNDGYKLAGQTKENMFKVCDLFYPFDDENKTYTKEGGYTFNDNVLKYEVIKEFESLNFNDRQFIDFRGMFELFPNVNSLSSFLNGNLSRYNIKGLLRPCKNIKKIVQCFCDTNINGGQEIDLYEFFNWEDNTTEVVSLFEGITDTFENGFVIKKTISYDKMRDVVLKKIEEYKNLTNLTNLFSYCTIINYNNDEIKFENTLSNIKNISNLFENCTSTCSIQSGKGVYNGGVLNIGRSFFEKLPNVIVAQRTFANTYLSSPLTYDYFCKRGTEFTDTDVYLSKDKESPKYKLMEREYNSNIINLKECFINTKFVGVKNWFDPNDSTIEVDRNYIFLEGNEEQKYTKRGFIYYIFSDKTGSFEEHTLDNDVFDDCLDNYTDYVPENSIGNKSGGPVIWYNHNLDQDFTYYGNIKNGVKPFDFINGGCDNTIQKTYCCLPPDFLYGCSGTANVNGIFANSNIVGVIPRNLTKKIKSKSISNIFQNVNIMPNLEYYYDINGSLNDLILDEIEETVDIYDGSDSDSDNVDYCVVYRDKHGILKKRKPVESDRSLGQFVYVPSNFTTSGNISNAFNFRYNLPRHWEMPDKSDDNVEYYKTTTEFDNAKIDVQYHSQYYFITDESVNWDNVFEAKSPFISSEQDIDFSNENVFGRVRELCDTYIMGDINSKNAWTEDNRVNSSWTDSIIENFHIDLNLCGKKNEYGMLVDNGCPVKYKNRTIHMDNFVSGILTVFLNGRVFDQSLVVNELTTSNHKSSRSSVIINYYGLGKNIILPYFRGTPLDKKFIFISIEEDSIFYDFMVENDAASKDYYYSFLVDGKLDREYLFETDYNKYTFK
jgi:hypothetical protein